MRILHTATTNKQMSRQWVVKTEGTNCWQGCSLLKVVEIQKRVIERNWSIKLTSFSWAVSLSVWFLNITALLKATGCLWASLATDSCTRCSKHNPCACYIPIILRVHPQAAMCCHSFLSETVSQLSLYAKCINEFCQGNPQHLSTYMLQLWSCFYKHLVSRILPFWDVRLCLRVIKFRHFERL